MIVYTEGAELPDLSIAVSDSTGELLDLSSGWTFSLQIKSRTKTLTKTTNINGFRTDPNVIISWATTNDLSTLAPDVYSFQLTVTHTPTGRRRKYADILRILPLDA